jgi:hypothetical protein
LIVLGLFFYSFIRDVDMVWTTFGYKSLMTISCCKSYIHSSLSKSYFYVVFSVKCMSRVSDPANKINKSAICLRYKDNKSAQVFGTRTTNLSRSSVQGHQICPGLRNKNNVSVICNGARTTGLPSVMVQGQQVCSAHSRVTSHSCRSVT